MDSVLVPISTGVAGIASNAVIASSSQDSTVQIVNIICGCVIAITHIVFGYLIYKSNKESKK